MGMVSKLMNDTSTTIRSAESRKSICPRYEFAIQLLGKRWTGLLLEALLEGPQRFCELTATVEGLSDRVLSDRLRELEAQGIVNRIVYPNVPVRVEYQLTEKGQALKPVVEAIHTWAEEWIELPQNDGPLVTSEASE